MTDITLLDGGMGQELVRRSGDQPTALWSTQVMLDHPGLVQQVHADYFASGATTATANTYAIHRDRLKYAGFSENFEDLHAAALAEVVAARAAHGSGRIAGAIGPLAASYQPDQHPDAETSLALYSEVAQILAPKVDVILIETASSLLNARTALRAATATGKPVWVAVSVSDTDGTRLRSGEATADVVDIVRDGGAEAVLVNCSVPEVMPDALRSVTLSGLPFGAYANAFTQITKGFMKEAPTVDALSARHDLGPAAYADHVMAWVDMGATIVGGCCETGPAHIAEIANRLRAAGHSIV